RARADEAQMKRFRHEAEVMAQIHHPNIVQIHDLGEYQGQPFLTLEHLDGGTLADRQGHGPLQPEQAGRLILPLGLAVHGAHGKGVTPTGVRPFNILLTAASVRKSTGFALAWLLQKERVPPKPRARRVLSNYMAPEQADPSSPALTPATDVHALGAMFYE